MKNEQARVLKNHQVVSRDEWLAARRELMAREKDLTCARDALSEARRGLPWERVEEKYLFEGPNGTESLEQLFEGRSQLVVYHAMFNPATATPNTPWTKDAACQSCSFWMDNFNGIVTHLNHRDVTMIAVSLAPYDKIAAYQKRMGWSFKWVSSGNAQFNFDYGVSFTADELARPKINYNYSESGIKLAELPGVSVFYKDPSGKVFHTYSSYARGIDMLNVAYHYLDLVPKGRDEEGRGQSWVRRHDEYEDLKPVAPR
jgi:predicted dithiol-disulfide oxidoreductase (DUF899 family)